METTWKPTLQSKPRFRSITLTDENDSDEILTDPSSTVMRTPTGRNADVTQRIHDLPVTGLNASES